MRCCCGAHTREQQNIVSYWENVIIKDISMKQSAKSSSSITILQFTRPTRPTYKFSLVGPTRVKTQYEITKIRRLSSPLRASGRAGQVSSRRPAIASARRYRPPPSP